MSFRFQDLSVDHVPLLKRFRCASAGDRWYTKPVERAITKDACDYLVTDPAAIFGYVALHPDLVDRPAGVVIVARVVDEGDPTLDVALEISALAVDFGHRRKGLGRELKLRVLEEAQRRGLHVRSFVHVDNERMNNLNDKLGALRAPAPDDIEYWFTVAKVPLP